MTLLVALVGFDGSGHGTELDALPVEAVASWSKNRVGLVDFHPLRISDDSLTVELQISEVTDVGEERRERRQTITVHKLDNKILVQRESGTETTIDIINGTEWFTLRRTGEEDWLLRGKELIEDVSKLRDGDLSSHPVMDLIGMGLSETNLVGFGASTFADTLVNNWESHSLAFQDNRLTVIGKFTSPPSDKITTLTFDSENEYFLSKVEERMGGSIEQWRVTTFSSSKGDQREIEKSMTLYDASDERKPVSVSSLTTARIFEERPDPAIFELENYSIIYTSPKSQSWMPTQILVPVLIGVSFIALAVYLRRKSA